MGIRYWQNMPNIWRINYPPGWHCQSKWMFSHRRIIAKLTLALTEMSFRSVVRRQSSPAIEAMAAVEEALLNGGFPASTRRNTLLRVRPTLLRRDFASDILRQIHSEICSRMLTSRHRSLCSDSKVQSPSTPCHDWWIQNGRPAPIKSDQWHCLCHSAIHRSSWSSRTFYE